MSTSDQKPPAPALKEIFDPARFRSIASDLTAIHPAFPVARFLKISLAGLADLTLMQRLRRMTESLHATLPADYHLALAHLRQLAPLIDRSFVTLVLPDFVGCYGLGHFDASMAALRDFTPFGSSEFGIREFLRHDLPRTLAVMHQWSLHENEHIRRLASEGCRPRLPWSFQLTALIADPAPVLPILENLRSDPSLYVRKSVANHLNDITKTHPDLVLQLLRRWPLANPHTAWIARHALRTLIKKGHPPALHLIGATGKAQIAPPILHLTPSQINLGETFTLTLQLQSTSSETQRLVIDYAIHYQKKSGTSRKVFKWKEITLPPRAATKLTRNQTIRDFTTRQHYPGRHLIDILINGQPLAQTHFDLQPAGKS
jgi:3-methyladenine DNA glycosylase AlkC